MKQLLLFDAKEMYAQTHAINGSPIKWTKKKCSSQYRKMSYDNLMMAEGMIFTSKYGLPQLHACNIPLDFEIHSFKERKKLKGKNQAIHFFADDYCFDHLLWHSLAKTTMELFKFDCVFAPDYSLYVDLPFAYNIINLYKSRFVASYWQLCGYNVVPTASWGNADSFKYCFDGLPQNSLIAVCGTGHNRSPSALRLWEYGMRELEMRLKPSLLFVYGPQNVIQGFKTPIYFIEDYITKKYRKAK
jgi:hypothetical protein